jgi:hypothetical protein
MFAPLVRRAAALTALRSLSLSAGGDLSAAAADLEAVAALTALTALRLGCAAEQRPLDLSPLVGMVGGPAVQLGPASRPCIGCGHGFILCVYALCDVYLVIYMYVDMSLIRQPQHLL